MQNTVYTINSELIQQITTDNLVDIQKELYDLIKAFESLSDAISDHFFEELTKSEEDHTKELFDLMKEIAQSAYGQEF